MNHGGFVNKQQFQAVFDHFKEVVAKAEAEENLLYVEFNLLLDYFRTVYSDSDRKSNKIMQLSSRVTKTETLLNELDAERAKETGLMSLQVNETKRKIDELVQKEHALLKQVDNMKAVINRLKKVHKEEDDDEEKETGENERNFREFGIVTDVVEPGWQSCEICSKKSPEALNQILKEIDFHKRRDEVIQEMNTKMNVLVTELKMAYKERDDLKALTQNYSQLLQELKQKLDHREKTRQGLEAVVSEKESMKVTIDKLVQDLYARKCEVQTLQEELQKEKSKWGACMAECKSKDKQLENMKRVLQAEREANETSEKKAEVFARHLATDRERREAMHGEVITLKLEADELRKQLKDCEGEQQALKIQMKVDEQHHRCELLERSHVVESYEIQVTKKNKKIEFLLNKLSESEKQLELLKKQTESKSNIAPTTKLTPTAELERLKAELRDVNSAHRTAQCQLETFRTALENQRSKMDSMKRTNGMLLKEKNKFFCRFKALDAKLESQKIKTKLILSERDYHRKVLRSIDNQVEKAAKIKEKSRVNFRY